MSRLLMSWSSGKDGAMALQRLRAGGEHEVVALLTTMVEPVGSVGMHGTPRVMVERQAAALGLPLLSVPIRGVPDMSEEDMLDSGEDYARAMTAVLQEQQALGVEAVAFGDIFLQDLRAAREAKLATLGLAGVFPLWGSDTGALMRELVDSGLRAVTTNIDSEKLPRELLGHVIDEEFLAALPADVDPCGEYGEFHSFVFDGPGFGAPVAYALGDVVTDDARYFRRELLPA